MRKLSLILLILFVLPLVLADQDYNNTGANGLQYRTGIGFFNEDLASTTLTPSALTETYQTPIVRDFDRDGDTEFLIMDDNQVTMLSYDTSTQTWSSAGTSFQNDDTANRYSNIIAYNIDNDTAIEIIFVTENEETMHILEYNGTAINNQTTYSMTGLTHTTGEIMVQCRGVQSCLIAYADKFARTDEANGIGDMYVAFFNTSGFYNEVNIDTIGAGTSAYCFSKWEGISVGDYDGSGVEEYVFPSIEVRTGMQQAQIYYISVIGDTPTLKHTIQETSADDGSETGANCGALGNYGRFITQAVLYDFDPPRAGLETVMGYAVGSDKFEMKIYDGGSNPSSYTTFPSTFQAQGSMVSNVMVGDIYGDTGNIDFCVLGQDTAKQELNLLCGSEETQNFPIPPLFIFQSHEFIYKYDGQFNVSQVYTEYNGMGSLAQHVTNTMEINSRGSNNPNELVSSHGVFKLSSELANGSAFRRTLTRIFTIDTEDTAVISVDGAKADISGGREDLVLLSDSNIFYLDDNFVNQQVNDLCGESGTETGTCTRLTADVCFDTTWKTNITPTFTLYPIDPDGDSVAVRVVLYHGDVNEQDSGWTTVFPSGTAIPVTGLITNKTIGTGVIRFQWNDSKNNVPRTKDYPLTVNDNGLDTGACSTDLNTGDPILLAPNGVLVDPEGNQLNNNTINRGINEYAQLFGVSANLVWILLMLLLGIAIVVTPAVSHSINVGANVMMASLVMLEGFMLIIGTFLGLLNTATVVTISILVFISLGIWLGKMFISPTHSV